MPAAVASACHTASLHSACRRPSTSLRGTNSGRGRGRRAARLRAQPQDDAVRVAFDGRGGHLVHHARPHLPPHGRRRAVSAQSWAGACAEKLAHGALRARHWNASTEPAAHSRSLAQNVYILVCSTADGGESGAAGGGRPARTSRARRCATRSGVVCCSSSSRVALRRASSAGVTGADSRHVTSYDFCFSASPACAVRALASVEPAPCIRAGLQQVALP